MDLVYSKMCPVACGACGRAAAMSQRGRRRLKEKSQAEYTAATHCDGRHKRVTLAAALKAGCHTVMGDLIGGDASGDVNLPSLLYVLDDISVEGNLELTSLAMPNLIHVGNDISVEDNPNLASLTMNSLKSAWGITVTYNDKLDTLTMPSLFCVDDLTVYPDPANCDLGPVYAGQDFNGFC
mmetsp:Transcript_24182/g.80375  ORF Transcript_24182/g.80375 Transcript_24182/m.80375 type:complete len:181 (-) Transcript_24182:287-829(-)